MSLAAAGAYLRALRRARRLSQQAVARHIGMGSYRQIQRWEAGEVEAGAYNLAAYTAIVSGDPMELHRLLLDGDATAKDGEELAKLRISLEKYGL